MCGIAGIILKQPDTRNIKETILLMNEAIQHRGPDGEGYILSNSHSVKPYFNATENYKNQHPNIQYLPALPIQQADPQSQLAFTHRRLAIIDLSPLGHQPMCNKSNNVWVTYNGELYNYIELREELINKGYNFISESDTEVILQAYECWGTECVKRFNGMWAFCIYDVKNNICFASRDRLGVKPFYYLNNSNEFAFSSEQKAFIKAGLIKARIDDKSLHNYLINNQLESEPENFFEDVFELFPGNNLVYHLGSHHLKVEPYFITSQLISNKNNQLDESSLINQITQSLEKSVRLRLRSDVEVGTCLSGGIDSSVLSTIIAKQSNKPLYCFTSVFRNKLFNEERFADVVANSIKAKHVKVEPSIELFRNEVKDLIYSQDVPIWSTSTYAQFKVMELAKLNGIKVVLDGQGADELFGGYHHHFMANWKSQLNQGKYLNAFTEIQQSKKSIPQPFNFFIKEIIKQYYNTQKNILSIFFKKSFIHSFEVIHPTKYHNDLNLQLIDDLSYKRLKSFLKCEDRCGMWHSVESRTPFSDDIELLELMFSFDGSKKIKNGVSKYLLREASKSYLPQQIYNRHDKKGFETPMLEWLNKMRSEMTQAIKDANFEFVNYSTIEKCNLNNSFEATLFFKLYVLSIWKNMWD